MTKKFNSLNGTHNRLELVNVLCTLNALEWEELLIDFFDPDSNESKIERLLFVFQSRNKEELRYQMVDVFRSLDHTTRRQISTILNKLWDTAAKSRKEVLKEKTLQSLSQFHKLLGWGLTETKLQDMILDPNIGEQMRENLARDYSASEQCNLAFWRYLMSQTPPDKYIYVIICNALHRSEYREIIRSLDKCSSQFISDQLFQQVSLNAVKLLLSYSPLHDIKTTIGSLSSEYRSFIIHTIFKELSQIQHLKTVISSLRKEPIQFPKQPENTYDELMKTHNRNVALLKEDIEKLNFINN